MRSSNYRREGWSSCVEMTPRANPVTHSYSSQPTWLPWLEMPVDYGKFRIATNNICTLFPEGRIWDANIPIIGKNKVIPEWRTSVGNSAEVPIVSVARFQGNCMHRSVCMAMVQAQCFLVWEWRHGLRSPYERPWAKITHVTPFPSGETFLHVTLTFTRVALSLMGDSWSGDILSAVSIYLEEILSCIIYLCAPFIMKALFRYEVM